MINQFRGKYFFLSNFYPCEIIYKELLYKNAESAFQSAKTLDMNKRKQFCELDPYIAKKKGRNIKLRSDWEIVKEIIMKEILIDKFTRNLDLKEKLINTGIEYLMEGNDHRDYYWGVYNCKGKNRLGYILMEIRDDILLKINK